MSYTHMPNRGLLQDSYSIETSTEVLHFSSGTDRDFNTHWGFVTVNGASTLGANGVNAIHYLGSSFLPPTVNLHSYASSIYFDEGDYYVDLEYLHRHDSGVIPDYYGNNSAAPTLGLTSQKSSPNYGVYYVNGTVTPAPSPLADGTFTQLGNHIYQTQTQHSTNVLKITLGIKFRVTGVIVPIIENYNWSAYKTYSLGHEFKMLVKKYPLNTLD